MVKVTSSNLLAIKPGDVIISINGHEIDDFLDIRFHTTDVKCLKIKYRRNGRTEWVIVRRKKNDTYLPLGLEEPQYLRCRNKCFFCFVDNLPVGLRPELYFKDDDYRLSFLCGNFITLTNIGTEELVRINQLRLSPLYVSVHTTNPQMRRRIFDNPEAAKIRSKIKKLVDASITLHGQIVLIPGFNDQSELNKTIDDLFDFYPSFASIGIVPVGTTKYARVRLPVVDRTYSLNLIAQISEIQKKFKKNIGNNFVYLADEFYLKARVPIPDKYQYDEFPQIENGIGIARTFLDDIKNLKPLRKTKGKFLFITGEIARPLVKALINKLEGDNIKLRGIKNRFFGHQVTVSGLLVGQDIKKAITRGYDRIFLPPSCVNENKKLLDDYTLDDLGYKNIQVAPESPQELVKWLT